MKDCECEGISAEERAFLDYLEKCFAAYPDRRVPRRFGVTTSHRQMANLGPGRLLRFLRHPSGEGLVAEAGSRDEIMKSAPPDDPCCYWEWDEETQQYICMGWC